MDKPNDHSDVPLLSANHPGKRRLKLTAASQKLWPEITNHFYKNCYISLINHLVYPFRKTRLSFPFHNQYRYKESTILLKSFFFFFRLSTSLLGTHRNHRRSKESILYLRRHLFQTYNSLKIKQNRKYEGKILCQKPFKDKVFHHSKLRKILS